MNQIGLANCIFNPEFVENLHNILERYFVGWSVGFSTINHASTFSRTS
jgi:hypothetical protein